VGERGHTERSIGRFIFVFAVAINQWFDSGIATLWLNGIIAITLCGHFLVFLK
jgi:hypothetical protein